MPHGSEVVPKSFTLVRHGITMSQFSSCWGESMTKQFDRELMLSMLLVEVGQTSRMAQLSVALDRTHRKLGQVDAQLVFARAAADRRTTRGELLQIGGQLGLKPTRREQVWSLPSEYLADDRTTPREDSDLPALALAERVQGALVPDATASGRVTR